MFILTSISLLLRLLEYGEGETSLPISASRFYLDSYVKRIKRKGERGVCYVNKTRTAWGFHPLILFGDWEMH
jgi:hypothetical protein